MRLTRMQKYYLAGACLTALFFIILASNYNDVALIVFDKKFGSDIYNLFGKGWVPLVVTITDLGSGRVCFPLIAALIIYGLLRKKDWIIALLIFNFIGVRFMNRVLKSIFERPRPHLHHLVHVGYYSFPSGHAMSSMAFYGFLAYLVHVRFKKAGMRSAGVWISAGSLIVLIGLSRIYLGVHYPTDILGGFFAGACWLFLTLLLYTFVPFKEARTPRK